MLESLFANPSSLVLAAAEGAGEGWSFAPAVEGPLWLVLIPLLPLLASVLCLGFLGGRVRTKLPAWTTVVLLGGAFLTTLVGYLAWAGGDRAPEVVTAFRWIHLTWGDGAAESLAANIGFYLDGLSWLWMLFVTGLATLIGLYASEYMQGDRGYARFFAAFGLFVVSMTCLVMGDNLILLYLGWEGVGLCSYLLIGYYYDKPSAVAAAKKAFIVNRIGDLGLALGVFLTFTTFGTVQYDELFRLVSLGVDASGEAVGSSWAVTAIPLLFMLGAFGKSAQFPLYVWLPDAMEGPTPVSALIHAATMVTAGVYLIARTFPIFAGLDGAHTALTVVAWVGAGTALLAATIGMAQFDIKRIMAYSTVSQLGYMFAGLGFLATTGAAYHVFTHAFFKASLFLACGAVMHGFAGQLDLRRLSGLWSTPGWRITSVCMLVGCLNLAGVPLTAGYFSKDMILAEAFVTPGMAPLGWVLLFTAGLTAYYTFRVFFRVFVGPVEHYPGDDHHDAEASHAAEEEAELEAEEHHGFHPHAPGWAINTVLVALTIGSLLAAVPYFTGGEHKGWVGSLLHDSSAYYVPEANYDPYVEDDLGAASSRAAVLPAADVAADGAEGHHGSPALFGLDPHKAMYYISAVFGLAGIVIAAFLHGPRGAASLGLGSRDEAARSRADRLLPLLGPLPTWAQNKWYVDELYDFLLRKPLIFLSHVFHAIDKLFVDGLVNLFGILPRLMGAGVRPAQSGVLQGYAAGMALGVGAILLVVFLFT